MDTRFFGVGHGRSGTFWLAQVLDCDPAVNVHHEPLAQFDTARYAKVYYNKLLPSQFIWHRRHRMEDIWERHPDKGYAEVNSYLRYCVPSLREEFYGVPIVGIVRDGRYVVRSLLARGCYQREGYPPIAPRVKMEPFAACCWYWATTYRLLERQAVPLYYLERLNADYDYFCELCQVAGVTVSRKDWERFAGQRMNVGVQEAGPPEWTAEERHTFARVAGDVQARLGYPL